jgi:aminoglycoside phosphotransferase (APT) family kinase protein
MSLLVNTDRFLHALAVFLTRDVVPQLQDKVARQRVEMAVGIIVRNIESQGGVAAAAARSKRSQALSTTVRGILDGRAAPGPFDALDTSRLQAALDEDHAPLVDAKETISSLFRELRKGEDGLLPPDEAKLEQCVRSHYSDDPTLRVTNVDVSTLGHGKQTVLFDCITGTGTVESLVMRRDRPQSFQDTTVTREFPVLKALYAAGFPVPEPLWLDASGMYVAEPYLVCRKVPGKPAGDGRGPGPDGGDNPVFLMADILARLHTLDPRILCIQGYSAEAWSAQMLLSAIQEWEGYYRRSASDTPVVALDVAFAWLRANCHLGLECPAIVHGEAGYHNILALDSKVSALLDWEFVHVGSAAEDLCYVRSQIESRATFDEFLQIYVERGGERPSIATLNFYDIYRLARNVAIYIAAVNSFNQGKVKDFGVVAPTSRDFVPYELQLYQKMSNLLRNGESFATSD